MHDRYCHVVLSCSTREVNINLVPHHLDDVPHDLREPLHLSLYVRVLTPFHLVPISFK